MTITVIAVVECKFCVVVFASLASFGSCSCHVILLSLFCGSVIADDILRRVFSQNVVGEVLCWIIPVLSQPQRGFAEGRL